MQGSDYRDVRLGTDAKVDDLLGRMTLDEKLAQLCSDLPSSFADGRGVVLESLPVSFPHGLGRFTQYSILGIADAARIAAISNDVQRYFVERTRLGIPVMFQAENLSGVPVAGATIFPSMLNAAATFRPELTGEVAAVIRDETVPTGIRQALSPVLDVARDPRWGRQYETFGEDPYVISQHGKQYVANLQASRTDGVLATAKHFLGYSVTQAGLNTAATSVTARDLYEVYATPFDAAMKDAGLAAVMASYSEIDGLPVGANPAILRELLRDRLGFDGLAVSDGGAIWKIFDSNHVSRTYEEAGLLALLAGLQTEMPVGNAFRQLASYVASGELSVDLIDEAVKAVLKTKFDAGLFENPYTEFDPSQYGNQEHLTVARRVSEESITLLANTDGFLPLAAPTKVALIGPHADSVSAMMSGYTLPSYIDMLINAIQASFHGMADEAAKSKLEESDDSEKPTSRDPFAGFTAFFASSPEFAAGVDVEALLRSRYAVVTLKGALEASGVGVSYSRGCDVNSTDLSGIAHAVATAQEADVVLLAVGGTCGWGDTTDGEGKDRAHLDLPGSQEALFTALEAVGTPIVVVEFGSRPLALARQVASPAVRAILHAWLPGLHGGQAVADTLLGRLNPGGKLPVTVPRSVGQVPIFYNHKMGSGYDDLGDNPVRNQVFRGGYVDEAASPLYAFGHGLSYSTFTLTDCTLASDTVPTDGTITVTATVTNTSDRAGSEVVQVYYRCDNAHVTRPVKQLVAFQRIELEAGTSARLTFSVPTSVVSYLDEHMDLVVTPGPSRILVGTASDAIHATLPLTLTGDTVMVTVRAFTSPCDVELAP